DIVLATMKEITAATVRARARSWDASDGCLASTWPHRIQPALPPGGSGGIRCNKSQSGQATDETVPVFRPAPAPSVASVFLLEGVVEAHPEQVHGEAVVDVIQRKIAICGANTRRYPGGGAGHTRVAALAEVHVVVFRGDRPRSAQPVVKPGADIVAAGLEVLAAGDAGRCSR